MCRAKLQLPASRNPSPFTASPISYADKVHPHQSIVKKSLCTPLRDRLTTRPKIGFMCGISVTSPSQRFLSYYVLKSTPSRHSSRLFIHLRIDNNRQYTKIQAFQASSRMRTSSGNSWDFEYTTDTRKPDRPFPRPAAPAIILIGNKAAQHEPPIASADTPVQAGPVIQGRRFSRCRPESRIQPHFEKYFTAERT